MTEFPRILLLTISIRIEADLNFRGENSTEKRLKWRVRKISRKRHQATIKRMTPKKKARGGASSKALKFYYFFSFAGLKYSHSRERAWMTITRILPWAKLSLPYSSIFFFHVFLTDLCMCDACKDNEDLMANQNFSA